MKLITAVKITIDWSESRFYHTSREFTSWDKTNSHLTRMCLHAPNNGTYDKTGFTIHWSDGDTYEGRIDLQRHMTATPRLLQSHIAEHLGFYAGTKRPAHLSPTQYEQYLADAERAGIQPRSEYLKYIHEHVFDDPNSWMVRNNRHDTLCELIGLVEGPDGAADVWLGGRIIASYCEFGYFWMNVFDPLRDFILSNVDYWFWEDGEYPPFDTVEG